MTDGADPVVRLLERAARDGHTAVPLPVVLAATSQAVLAAAAHGGGVVVADDWVALEELADAEAAVADEVLGLAAEDRLALVLGQAPEGADVVEVRGAHRRPLTELASELQAVPPDVRVVVSGDPDALQAAGVPGAVLADLLGWGRLPVRDLRAADTSTSLGALQVGLRGGELLDPADQSVVIVACADDAEAVRRVGQLVADSIPRVFGVASTDVLVVTPQHRGAAGTRALTESLPGGVRVCTVHEAADADPADAVVACLPAAAAGVLTRALVYTAACMATRHLSVVTACGDALPRAVASVPARTRWTRLPSLLAAGLD